MKTLNRPSIFIRLLLTILLVAALALLALAVAPLAVHAAQACSPIGFVSATAGTKGVNIRAEGNANAKLTGGMVPGDPEKPVDLQQGSWVRLCEGGWINSSYATLRLVPVVTSSATATRSPTATATTVPATSTPLASETPGPTPTILGSAQAIRTATAQALLTATPRPVTFEVCVEWVENGTAKETCQIYPDVISVIVQPVVP